MYKKLLEYKDTYWSTKIPEVELSCQRKIKDFIPKNLIIMLFEITNTRGIHAYLLIHNI